MIHLGVYFEIFAKLEGLLMSLDAQFRVAILYQTHTVINHATSGIN